MWYVLHTQSHAESQVCRVLAIHGAETYAPQFPPPPRSKVGSVRSSRQRRVFPNYVFFRVPSGFAAWERIRWMPGVRNLLHSDGIPAMVGEDLVDRIRERLVRWGQPMSVAFEKGQPVVIERGPLTMVDAIFERNLDGPARVRILIQLMGRSLPIEVDSSILRAAS